MCGGQQLVQIPAYPGVRLLRVASTDRHSGKPEVMQHVQKVERDGDRSAAPSRLGLELVHLILVAVDERDARSVMVRIAPVGFVEHVGDAGGHVLLDAGCYALSFGARKCARGTLAVAA